MLPTYIYNTLQPQDIILYKDMVYYIKHFKIINL